MTDDQRLLPFPTNAHATPSDFAESPASRLLRAGGTALTDAELLGLLLPAGSTDLAASLLQRFEGLPALAEAHAGELAEIPPSDLIPFLAGLEMARRLGRSATKAGELLDGPDAVVRYLEVRYGESETETLGVVYLTSRNRLIAEETLGEGSIDPATVEPAAILEKGLLSSAAAFLLFHIDLSQSPSPSPADLALARRIADAGRLLGIALADYIILGSDGRWLSLLRRGAF